MIKRYVNLNSSSGGDGTTNAITGANRAYASLSEFESSEQASVTDDITVYCSGGEDSNVTFAGWTFNGYTITIVGDCVGGNGIDTTSYHIRTTADGMTLSDNSSSFVLKNMQVWSGPDSADQSIKLDGTSSALVIYDSIITCDQTTSTDALKMNCDSTSTITIHNSCIYPESGSTGGTGINTYCSAYNCNINGCSRAIRSANVIKNCILQNNTTDVFGDPTTASNNLTDSGTLFGSNNVVSTTLTFKYPGDCHLAYSDTDPLGAGIGPASDANVYGYCADGNPRTGTTCDIGLVETPISPLSRFGKVVQKKTNSATSGTSIAVTLDKTPKIGNLLIATHHTGDSVSNGISTSGWGTPDAMMTNSTEADEGSISSKIFASGDSTTITATSPNSDEQMLIVIEVEGPFAATPLDVAYEGSRSASASTYNVNNTTALAQAIEFTLAAVIMRTNTGYDSNTWDSGFQQYSLSINSGSAKSLAVAFRDTQATTAPSTTVTFGTANTCVGALVSYKAASSVEPPASPGSGLWKDIARAGSSLALDDVDPDPGATADYKGTTGFVSVCSTWNGAVMRQPYDTIARLSMEAPGGHLDYYGNSGFNLDTIGSDAAPDSVGWERHRDPTPDTADLALNDANGTGLDDLGAPCARHTYNYPAYDFNRDEFWFFGGAFLAGDPPPGSSSVLKLPYRLTDQTWNSGYTAKPSGGASSVRGHVHYLEDGEFGIIDYSATAFHKYNVIGDSYEAWTPGNAASTAPSTGCSLYDKKRGRIVIFGYNAANVYIAHPHIGGAVVKTCTSVPGGLTFNSQIVGGCYDEYLDKYVFWDGGEALYDLDPITFAFTTRTLPTQTVTPTSAATNGTFNRFQYIRPCTVFPTGAYVVVNATDESTYLFYDVEVTSGTGTVVFPQMSVSSAGTVTAGPEVSGSATTSFPMIGAIGQGVSYTAISGAGNLTFTPLSISSIGLSKHQGTGSATLLQLAINGSGVSYTKISGISSITFSQLQISSTGDSKHSGNASTTFPQLNMSSSGNAKSSLAGSGSLSFPQMIPTSTGNSSHHGTGAVFFSQINTASSGSVISGISGTGIVSFPQLQITSSGVSSHVGNSNVTLPQLNVASFGNTVTTITGNGALFFPQISIVSSGTYIHDGNGVATLPQLSTSGTAFVTSGVIGSGNVSMPNVGIAGVGNTKHIGNATISFPQLLISGTGNSKTNITGIASVSLVNVSISGVGTSGKVGTGSLSLPQLFILSSGISKKVGDGASTLPQMSISSSGNVGSQTIGTGSVNFPQLSSQGDGLAITSINGTSIVSFPILSISGTGNAVSDITGSGIVVFPIITISASGSSNRLTEQIDLISKILTEISSISKINSTISMKSVIEG